MRVAAPTVFEAYRKFKINLARQFPTRQQQRILDVSLDRARLEQMPVNEYLDLYVI